jgi:hypothetical protein
VGRLESRYLLRSYRVCVALSEVVWWRCAALSRVEGEVGPTGRFRIFEKYATTLNTHKKAFCCPLILQSDTPVPEADGRMVVRPYGCRPAACWRGVCRVARLDLTQGSLSLLEQSTAARLELIAAAPDPEGERGVRAEDSGGGRGRTDSLGKGFVTAV